MGESGEQADQPTTVGLAIAERLTRHGIGACFGLIGSSTLELYEGLRKHADRIRYVGCRDERSAAFMAEAYSRRLQSISVVLAGQSGPGVTNLATGVALARTARTPLLVIGGAVSSSHRFRVVWQELDQQAFMKPIAKEVLGLCSPESACDLIDDAIEIATTPPCGPVYIDAPRDLLRMPVSTTRTGREIGIRGSVRVPHLSDEEGTAEIAQFLAHASRPAILAGGGVKASPVASELLGDLARRLGAPILASYGNRDVVDNSHELFCGQMGPRGSSLSESVLRQADSLLVVGSRLGFGTTFLE
ncbi:MAG: thiamine pyrophosphate-binding protein, partial [Chloroflexota bacterium]